MKFKLKEILQGIAQNKEIIIILVVIWIILFESLSLFILISGILASIIVILFTDKFLLKGNYEFNYLIGLTALIHFVLRLLLEILIAGIHVIPNILRGQGEAQIITCRTLLKEELLIDLLANAITLTPGTVTIDKKGSELKILVLNPPAADEKLRNIIPLRLEEILMHYEEKSTHKNNVLEREEEK